MDSTAPSSLRSSEEQGADLPKTGKLVKTQDDQASPPSESGAGTPRRLHITHSVYIRHIPPKISSEDIVEVASCHSNSSWWCLVAIATHPGGV